MATVSDIIGKVAAHVDPADHWISSSPIITIIQLAITEFERRMRAAEVVSVLTEEVELTVAAGVNKLNSSSTPPLPTDFEAPYRIWEKPAASATGYKEARQIVGMLPDDTLANATIGLMYQWRNKEIRFGTVQTASVKLKLIYWLRAATVSAPADTMPYPRFEDVLVNLVTAGAARTRGMKALVDEYEAKAAAAIGDIKLQEGLTAKAKPKEFGNN